MTPEEFNARYADKAHAVQTGIAAMQTRGYFSGEHKHSRVGINLVMRDLGSLIGLLIEKGVLAEDDVYEAVLKGLDEEIADYERDLGEALGSPVRIA